MWYPFDVLFVVRRRVQWRWHCADVEASDILARGTQRGVAMLQFAPIFVVCHLVTVMIVLGQSEMWVHALLCASSLTLLISLQHMHSYNYSEVVSR